MELKEACEQFNSLVTKVSSDALEQFLLRTKENINDRLENLTDTDNAKVMLDSIRQDIRRRLPDEATTPTETIGCPTSGKNADCDIATTVHVDAFLYDDETLDEMCEAGDMSRNYCATCLSKSVKPLTFITHSASVAQMMYIYQYLLPDLRNKTVLDVGSRTGALLYGAYFYSEAAQIIGVELDQTFCELQRSIVHKYEMINRIQIVHSDIMLQTKLLQNCDAVILNNVFEFFMPVEKQVQIWNFLFKTLRKSGAFLITIPSIEESLSNVKLQLDIHKWLAPVDIEEKKKCAMLKYFKHSEDSDLDELCMYRVL